MRLIAHLRNLPIFAGTRAAGIRSKEDYQTKILVFLKQNVLHFIKWGKSRTFEAFQYLQVMNLRNELFKSKNKIIKNN